MTPAEEIAMNHPAPPTVDNDIHKGAKEEDPIAIAQDALGAVADKWQG